jgi:CelD/BcsL family acetyltransferase involved in cellulose biosynthesis
LGWVNKTTKPVTTCHTTGIQQKTNFTKHGATSYAHPVTRVKFDQQLTGARSCVRRGTSMTDGDRVTLARLPPLGEVERDWRELETRSDRSFFTSWSWIGAWLSALPSNIRPELLRVESQGRTVALGVLVRRFERRHGVFSSRALSLNSTGDPTLDEITIEYNGLVCERGFEQEVAQACVEFLLSRDDWDEWFLDGLQGSGLSSRVPAREVRWVLSRQAKCYYVDLEALRRSGGEYLALLGSNTRHNIRRSIREYEKLGPLVLENAATPEQASGFLSGLTQLHQAYWQAKGLPGSFANPFFVEFHQRLMRSLSSDGSIQLLHLRAGDQSVGYLYNFVDRGRVYNYQSGFNYTLCPNSHGHPGLVTHAYAVELNRTLGHRLYEFMAGDGQHKQALGVGSTDMVWLVARRLRLSFLLEDCLRWVRARTIRTLSEMRKNRGAAAGAVAQPKNDPAAAQGSP